MERTWQTEEVFRYLEDVDIEDLREVIESSDSEGIDTEIAVERWFRSGNASKAFHDAIYRFANEPTKVYQRIEWDEVVLHISQMERCE